MKLNHLSQLYLVDKICSDETLGKLKACLMAVVQNEHGRVMHLKLMYTALRVKPVRQ